MTATLNRRDSAQSPRQSQPPFSDRTGRYWSTNELHAIKADASPVSIADAINERLIQAAAVVNAIRADGVDDNDGFMMSHTLVCDMLWAVDSMIEQARLMNDHLGTYLMKGALA